MHRVTILTTHVSKLFYKNVLRVCFCFFLWITTRFML